MAHIMYNLKWSYPAHFDGVCGPERRNRFPGKLRSPLVILTLRKYTQQPLQVSCLARLQAPPPPPGTLPNHSLHISTTTKSNNVRQWACRSHTRTPQSPQYFSSCHYLDLFKIKSNLRDVLHCKPQTKPTPSGLVWIEIQN